MSSHEFSKQWMFPIFIYWGESCGLCFGIACAGVGVEEGVAERSSFGPRSTDLPSVARTRPCPARLKSSRRYFPFEKAA
jgi:hypothetical protein